jgi:menaquinone-9 beta-reductase
VRYDVIVAGAGPAGALAATILARRGARVLLMDRARFPRPKLCGDTLNPGALRQLQPHIPLSLIENRSLPIAGMVLTGPHVEVRGTYPDGQQGRALSRSVLDSLLLDHATAAGAEVQEKVAVQAPHVDERRGRVAGVVVKRANGTRGVHEAHLVIAADGRESRLARASGLAHHPAHPRRWAIGGYFEGVDGLTSRGEMHVRAGYYVGVAPLPDALTNVCLVITRQGRERRWNNPGAMLQDYVGADPRLRHRFTRARLLGAPQVLGPMAVEVSAPGVPGMLLAGDAAGFIDPITGDGLRFALAGAAMAAEVAEDMLGGRLDMTRAVEVLRARRRAMFVAKWRFNRAVRALVSRPALVATASMTARMWPSAFHTLISYAGDCDRHTAP